MSNAVAEGRTHSINCPQCGGIVSNVDGREYHQCDYCQTLVFSNENPMATDRLISLGTEMNALCPCCHLPMQQGELDERPVLYCGRCYGFLIRTEHFGAALRERRAKRDSADVDDPKPIDMKQYERSLECPNCQRRMEVHPYYGPGNVVIDTCGNCSLIWLDHAEFSRLERANGGRQPASDFHGYAAAPTLISPGQSGSDSSNEFEPEIPSPLQQLFELLFH